MKKTAAIITVLILTLNTMAQTKINQTAGRTQLADFAPDFAVLNDTVLFGDNVWNNPALSHHDRSMITISILLGKGIIDTSFRSHLEMGKRHGITRAEIAALITHAAFYAGWPNAWTAFRMAKEVWAADTPADNPKDAFQQQMIFPLGEPNTAYARYFTGNSYLAPVSREQVNISNVTFEPRCRNNWHIHHARKGGGQILIGIAGRGWYQEENRPASRYSPEQSSTSPQAQNTGTAQPPTPGSRTSP